MTRLSAIKVDRRTALIGVSMAKSRLRSTGADYAAVDLEIAASASDVVACEERLAQAQAGLTVARERAMIAALGLRAARRASEPVEAEVEKAGLAHAWAEAEMSALRSPVVDLNAHVEVANGHAAQASVEAAYDEAVVERELAFSMREVASDLVAKALAAVVQTGTVSPSAKEMRRAEVAVTVAAERVAGIVARLAEAQVAGVDTSRLAPAIPVLEAELSHAERKRASLQERFDAFSLARLVAEEAAIQAAAQERALAEAMRRLAQLEGELSAAGEVVDAAERMPALIVGSVEQFASAEVGLRDAAAAVARADVAAVAVRSALCSATDAAERAQQDIANGVARVAEAERALMEAKGRFARPADRIRVPQA